MISLAGPARAEAKIPSLCFITFDPSTLKANRYGPFFNGLRSLGYVDGKSIAIQYLSAEGHGDRFPALANECVRARVDVIVVATTPAAQAAKNATKTIPIVMLALGDPVSTGLATSLARPDANITGLTFIAPSLAAKRLELLKDTLPSVKRVLVLSYYEDPIAAPELEAIRESARGLRLDIDFRDVRSANDMTTAVEAGVKSGAEALMTTAESIFAVNAKHVAELARRHRLPGIYGHQQIVLAGGLMSYTADYADLHRRAASYVDKLLKGAKAAELPIEQPTNFHLFINRRAAAALGIAIPQELMLRADRVIE